MELAKYLDQVRKSNPLVHHITNYVTVNDCANACLAIGASPVMSDAIDEVGDMAAISSALVLNIGTLNVSKVESMIEAGRSANAHHIPVVFDPVGCGATSFRNWMAAEIMNHVHMSVIRGNMSEVLSLGGVHLHTKGVDAGETVNLEEAAELASKLSQTWNAVVVISSKVDIITDGNKKYLFITDVLKCRSLQAPVACVPPLSVPSAAPARRIPSEALWQPWQPWAFPVKEPGKHTKNRDWDTSIWAYWMNWDI